MKDHPVDYDDVFLEITADDVNEFWTSRKVKSECELCETDDWRVHLSVKDTVPVMVFHRKYEEINRPNIYPLLMVSCSNCGNMRILDRPTIVRWKISKEGT